jgi:NAD-dependent SIR2 family protein deacetylase
MFAMSGEVDLLKCSGCAALKPPEEFSWRRRKRGQRDSFCRPCRAAYGKAHYAAHRKRYIEQARKQKQRLMLERTRWLVEYFRDHPCADCGERDPVVLEFDHLRDKTFAIGPQLSQRSWKSILEEIEKCEVVCANCHRRRTARRRGTARLLLTQAVDRD